MLNPLESDNNHKWDSVWFKTLQVKNYSLEDKPQPEKSSFTRPDQKVLQKLGKGKVEAHCQ